MCDGDGSAGGAGALVVSSRGASASPSAAIARRTVGLCASSPSLKTTPRPVTSRGEPLEPFASSRATHLLEPMFWRYDREPPSTDSESVEMTVTALDRFSSSFADEHALRRAVVALLEKMPGVTAVRDTHGTRELGKDIVFETAGGFGLTSLNACVLKNHPITGDADDNRGARVVYIQAEQAFDSEIRRAVDGIPVQVGTVWIVSPHELSQQAIASIAGKLEQNKDRVRFICGRDLYEMFRRFYREYLMFEAGDLGRMAANAVTELDTDGAVPDALQLYGIAAPSGTLRSTYIPSTVAKHLYAFNLVLVMPDVAVLGEPLKKAAANDIARQLALTGDLIDSISGELGHSHKTRETASALGVEIKSAWDEAFRREKNAWTRSVRESREVGWRPPPPTNNTPIWLGNRDALQRRAKKLLADWGRSIARIQVVLSEANRLSEEVATDTSGWMSSPFLATYRFVENLSYRYPGMLRRTSTWPAIPVVRLKGDQSRFLIAGPPGTGKTSYCKWQAIHDLEQLRLDGRRIPVFVPLYRLSARQLETFEEAFFQDPLIADLWKTRESHERQFMLYLDGLDELPDAPLQQRVVELAVKMADAEERLSVVITGRDYVFAPALRYVDRVSLERFDNDELIEFIDNWYATDTSAKAAFERQLDDVPSLREVMRIPLLGTLVLRVADQGRPLPASRVKLYEMFTQLLAGGWDLAKRVNRGSQFGPTVKIPVLASLANNMQEVHRREFTDHDFSSAVADVFPVQVSQAHALLAETCRDGLIVPEGRVFAFAHQSFQEYLAASHLTEPGGEKARRAILKFLSGDEWWREVVKFYLAFSPTPHASLKYIDKAAARLHSRIQDAIIQPRVRELRESVALVYPGSVI